MPQSSNPTLELSMIVKNGGTDLERCLRSAARIVDRIVIGDTGSTDDTKSIAHKFNAEVLDIPWEQDFAKARNQLIERSTSDWLLILDADEMLDEEGGRQIRALIESQEIDAYHNPRWNYVTDTSTRINCQAARKNPQILAEARDYPAYVPLPTTRLFRNRRGIFFEGCVHETLAHRLESLHLRTAKAEFVVHHFGHVHEEVRRAKDELYHQLGKKKLEADPHDAQVLVEAGVSELEHKKNPRAALDYFKQARTASPSLAAAWLYSGICLTRLGQIAEALACLERAGRLGMANGVLYQAVGDAHFQASRFKEANEAYVRVAERGEASPLSEAKRGASEVHLGQAESGLARMVQAVRDAPNSAELYDVLAAGALLAGNLAIAVEAMQARIAMGNLTDFHTQFVAVLEAKFKVATNAGK